MKLEIVGYALKFMIELISQWSYLIVGEFHLPKNTTSLHFLSLGNSVTYERT